MTWLSPGLFYIYEKYTKTACFLIHLFGFSIELVMDHQGCADWAGIILSIISYIGHRAHNAGII